MEIRRMLRALVVFLVLIAPLSAAAALADDTASEKARADEFLAFAVRESKVYAFRPKTAGAPFKLKAEPILRWSNPVAGSLYGDVFVWTAQGRPAVIGSFHKWYSPHKHRANEFLSLSGDSIVGEREG